MTLNFACRPTIFPANPSEDNLVSSIGITNRYVVEGNPERNGDGFGKPRRFNWEIEDSYDYRRDRDDWGDSRETISNDILDILPSDPFGMDISATFTAITGWIEDLEADSESFGRDEVGAMKADYQFVAGFNFFWNKAMRFQAEPGFMEINERSNPVGRFDECVEDMELGEGSYDGAFVSACNEDDDDSRVSNLQAKEPWEGTENSLARNGENPHEALFFALSYLGVQDLLSVERVCKSLHSAVQNDTLVWRSIHIDHPLSERITDDALLQLTNRAQGSLHCLSLVDCSRITDDGLKHVLESNPKLVKLSVPRCTRLSVEGIVNNLKAFKSSGAPGIKHLRIGGLYGVTNHHFDELKLLLGTESFLHPKVYKPRFYHSGRSSFSCDDDRAIDIENCPKCQNLRLVYDCPAESCQGKQAASQLCRACILCIARCVHCGRCINNGEYEETFCLDLLCLDCWKQHSIFHQKTRYLAKSGSTPYEKMIPLSI